MAEYIVEEPSDRSASWRVRERIVRCRDCKHMCEHDLSAYYGNHEYDQCSCCRLLDPGAISVKPDGFCAWGETEEGENGTPTV